MPDPRYVGRVTLTLCPGDRLWLGREYLEDAIPLFLDDIVHDSGPFPPAFRAGFNEDCRHVSLPDCCRSRRSIAQSQRLQQAANGLPAGSEARLARPLRVGEQRFTVRATTPKVFCNSAAQRCT